MTGLAEAEPWVRGFLLQGTRTAALATVRADGAPHVKPVWFLLDDDVLVFTTGAGTVAGRNLAREPRVALSVDDSVPPFSFVALRGRAQLSEELAEVRRWAGLIGARYGGADREQELAERNGVPGELLVRVIIDHVAGARDVAS